MPTETPVSDGSGNAVSPEPTRSELLDFITPWLDEDIDITVRGPDVDITIDLRDEDLRGTF